MNTNDQGDLGSMPETASQNGAALPDSIASVGPAASGADATDPNSHSAGDSHAAVDHDSSHRNNPTQNAAPAMPDAAGKPASPAAPTLDARRKRLAIIIAAAVLALIVAAVIVGNISRSRNDPRPLVEKYMAALADGDYGQAARMESADLTDAQKALLADGVIADASQRVSTVSIGEFTPMSSTERSVDVTYAVDGNPTTATLVVKRSGSGLAASWSLERSMLGAVNVPAGDAALSIGGVTPTAESQYTDTSIDTGRGGDGTITVAAYPGIYPVAPAGVSSRYVTVKPSADTVTVRPQETSVVTGTLTATQDLADEVERQMAEHLQKCVDNANAGGATDESCYVNADYAATHLGTYKVYSDETYEVNSFAVDRNYTVGVGDLAITDKDGTLTTSVSDYSSVTVDYTYSFTNRIISSDRINQERTITVMATGHEVDVTIDGDAVTLDYGDAYGA